MTTPAQSSDCTKALITFGFMSILALMILVSWVSMATLSAANQDMALLVRDNDAKTSLAFQMRDAIRQRTGAAYSLQLINAPDERQRVMERLVDYTETYHSSRAQLSTLAANEQETRILQRLTNVDGRVQDAYDKAGERLFTKASDPEALRAALGEVKLQELVLLNHLNELVKLEKALALDMLQDSQETQAATHKLLLLIVSTAFALAAVISSAVVLRVTRANRRIAHLASHDDLTGLRNRRAFEDHLSHTIGQALRRSDDKFGLLYLDLDRFKIVNDTCGHHAGDLLLLELTRLISNRLRSTDLFARVGGDEFAIITRERNLQGVIHLAEDLRQCVADYTFHYAEQSFKVSLSIGVVPIDGQTTDMERLLSDVDSACYVAKQSGRNRVHVAQHNDQEVVKYRSDLAGMQSIRQALDEQRLVLFYQPVYAITANGTRMEHCEILLRIRSESGELFSPARFIPIAEKYNLMSEIDRWVFSSVIDWVRAHQGDYLLPRLLINLSGLSFVNDEFLLFVEQRLQRGDVDPQRIAFEITETAAVDNLHKANHFIARIRALGCQFALDDFGSGFSTFAYLKQLNIDYLKIDGSLVKDLATDHVDREMVRAINDIGHCVGAKTIAEFVENDRTLEHLRELGVDYAQGYGLCQPRHMELLVDDIELMQTPMQRTG